MSVDRFKKIADLSSRDQPVSCLLLLLFVEFKLNLAVLIIFK